MKSRNVRNFHVPYPSTKEEKTIDSMMVLVMWNSSATCAAAGAIIDEAMGDMNVNADTASAAAHFVLTVQLDSSSSD